MSLLRVKAMRVPSGDQAGLRRRRFSPCVEVRFTGLEPSAFMTKMSLDEAKAMRVPSGDQAGSELFLPVFVRFTGLEPSASITKMSLNEAKAMRPSNVKAVHT